MILIFRWLFNAKWQCLLLVWTLFTISSTKGAELTLKIDSLNTRALEKQFDNPREAISLAKQALYLADSINYVKGLSTINNYLGIFHFNTGQFLEAEEYFLKTIEYRKEIGYEEGVAYIYENLCGLRGQLGDYPASINYGFQALNIFKKFGRVDEELRIYINLGSTHHDNGDINDAHKY